MCYVSTQLGVTSSAWGQTLWKRIQQMFEPVEMAGKIIRSQSFKMVFQTPSQRPAVDSVTTQTYLTASLFWHKMGFTGYVFFRVAAFSSLLLFRKLRSGSQSRMWLNWLSSLKKFAQGGKIIACVCRTRFQGDDSPVGKSDQIYYNSDSASSSTDEQELSDSSSLTLDEHYFIQLINYHIIGHGLIL